MGRRAGGVSIVAVLVATSVLVLGVGLAWADTVALLVQTVDSGAWSPASNDPSGAAYISGGAGYLFVVDTNRNQPDSNGWMMDIHTGDAVSRATGVDEPTGIEYDPVNNTLFISSDAGSGSFIEVITDFDTRTGAAGPGRRGSGIGRHRGPCLRPGEREPLLRRRRRRHHLPPRPGAEQHLRRR